MAWCPFAVQKPLKPENTQEPRIVPLQMILHTAVSDATSLFGYFSRRDVVTESHFYVAQDGTVEQYMDTTRQADAQFDGNLHGVSVETWDNADPNRTPLTDQQVSSYIRLAQWLNSVHGIPLTACSGPQNPGQGYHSMFPQWAKDGHTCPNTLRIRQFWNVLLPGMQAPPPKPPTWSSIDMVPAQVRDHDGRKWFFVVGDDLDCWASVDDSGFFPVLPRGTDGKPRAAFTSGFSAMQEADGQITICGRGADGRAWQIIFTPGGVQPFLGVVDSHPHHIFPPA